MTLVDVHLPAGCLMALRTLEVEAAVCVHTHACVLTRIAVGIKTQAPVTRTHAPARISTHADSRGASATYTSPRTLVSLLSAF